MLTLGDVVASIALVFGTAIALACASFVATQVFPRSTGRGACATTARPWLSGGVGLAVSLPALFVAVVLFNIPNELTRALGTLVLFSWGVFLVVGTGAIVEIVADRLHKSSSALSRSGALFLASGVLALAFVLPFVGWFVLAPIASLCGLGGLVRGRAYLVPSGLRDVEAQ